MTAPDADGGLQGRRVLVVEDEALLAMELDGVLRQQGCTVLGPAATVDRAVALIGAGRPEAALLDLNLDGRSALPVAAALNARGVPFLVVSGYGEAQSRAPELSRAPRLAKPVHPSKLVRKLVRKLARLLATVPRG
jgi:DNA-binding response OmpR family regulator